MRTIIFRILFLSGLIFSGLSVLSQPSFALSLEGELSVADSLRVQRTDGFKARIYSGKYKCQLWNIGERNMLLRVEKNDAFVDIPMQIPKSHPIPRQGEFNVPGNVMSQTFDISGRSNTFENQSESIRTYEDCTYYRDEWVCRGRGRHRYCQWETVAYPGAEEVEYYFLTTTFKIDIELVSQGDQPASFSGQTSERKKIYTYRGECF